ncbi:MAG: hypothetical protein NUV98_00370 [Candidatus Roizmanbacteria bacterium]|nr:hypothetical protein [Candidatus Roizmanbacteria bacterium]
MDGIYSLKAEHSSLTVDVSGGRIVGLVLNDMPILGTFNRIDGKTGNTHVCVPNFGDEGVKKYRLPFHGPARTAEWKLVSTTDSSLTIRYDMPKTGSYPTTVSIIQTFTLKQHSFTQEVSTINTGKEAAPLNLAIHYYWCTPQGWNDLLLNGVPVSEYIKQDTSIDAGTKSTIHIPSHSDIQLVMSGHFKKLQLWTARKEEGGNVIYDQKYACIEPVLGTGDFFGSRESNLLPDEALSVWARITI